MASTTTATERSSNAPINLWVSLDEALSHELPIWEIVAPHVHRCHSLRLKGPVGGALSNDDVFPLPGKFPYLTHLRIQNMHSICGVFELGGTAPHLSHLSLDLSEVDHHNGLKDRYKILRLVYSHEQEELGRTPYWDAADREFVEQAPSRGLKRDTILNPSLRDSNELLLRLRLVPLRPWVEILPHLEHITIAKADLSLVQLFSIGRLSHLKSLTFMQCPCKNLLLMGENTFPALEHLSFYECEDLVVVQYIAYNSAAYSALRKITSHSSLQWMPEWRDHWTEALLLMSSNRSNLMFEWCDGRSNGPWWSVDAVQKSTINIAEVRVDGS
ncbi:hypothetical protein DL93DRAFT_2087490 [Clavulina sp. PMI_390]|nr:hypothetical protein DL93DRAFT_2087490 [Clavulina sp. PMI_390]